MSRETTPVEIPTVGHGAAGPRSTSKRRAVPNANSLSYGSQGRTSAPVELNPDLAEMNPLEAIRAAVQIADARPIGRSQNPSKARDDDMSAIQEEDEVVQSRGDSYNIEKEFNAVDAADDSSDSEKEVETGPGNQTPQASERGSRSFGTEDPILGAGRRAQAKTGPLGTTGELSGEASVHLVHQEQEIAGPSLMVTNLLRLLLVALILFLWYQGTKTRPSMSKVVETEGRPAPIFTDMQYNHLLDRLQKVEASLNVPPSQPEPARVNFFSPGIGAMVDPHLTSPSNMHGYRARAWHHWGLGKYNGKAPGPLEALTPWEDVGDCWCAAPSGDGKSQLAVMLPHRIVPTHLVVEHVQKGMTLGIGAAPRDLELWVQILDDDQRDSVISGANDVLTRSTMGKEDAADATSRTDDFLAEKSLDRTWVRIASFRYDVDAPRHVQTFEVDVRLDYWGLAANKVAVRVKNNYGPSDYTCLYRLKLHGHLAEPPTEEYAPEYLHEKRGLLKKKGER